MTIEQMRALLGLGPEVPDAEVAEAYVAYLQGQQATPAPLALSASDVVQLKKALASGAQRVRYADGREVMYRSLAEMREIIRMAEGEASGTNGGGYRRKHSIAGF